MDGVAGEDVGAAGAVGVEEPAAVGVAALDLDRILGVVGDDRGATLLLPPAECRHVVVVAVQEPGLAGAGLRGPVGLPAVQLVRAVVDPALDVRRPPGGDRPFEHLVGEPVDLEEEDAGDVRAAEPIPLPRLGADDVAVPALVVVDRQQRRGRRGRDGEEQGYDDRFGEPCHLGVGDEVDGEGDEDGIDDDRREAEGEDVERQGEPRQGREDERVEDAD